MRVDASRFGQIEVDDDKIIVFPEGIPGFSGRQRFLVLKDGLEETPFWWLQNVDRGELCFLLVEPSVVFPDYDFVIADEQLRLLCLSETSSLEALVIVSVPDADFRRATVNLKAPILINSEARLGSQLVLDQSAYAIRHPLFAEVEV